MFLVIILVVTAKSVASYNHDTCMEARHLYIMVKKATTRRVLFTCNSTHDQCNKRATGPFCFLFGPPINREIQIWDEREHL